MRTLGKTGEKISILGYGCGSQFMLMPDGEYALSELPTDAMAPRGPIKRMAPATTAERVQHHAPGSPRRANTAELTPPGARAEQTAESASHPLAATARD